MKRKIKTKLNKKALPMFVAVALFCFAFIAKAENKVIFNEIMYDPDGSDTKREWFEIFNSGEDEVDLNGWKFFESGTNHSLSLIKGGFILKKAEYAVVAENAEYFLTEYPDFEGNLIDSSFSLSNTGEILQMKNKSGDIISETTYKSETGGGDNGFSLEFEDDVFRESYEKGGTPGKKNSEKPVLKEEDKTLRLNEILPNPSGKEENEEYIEIYNFGERKINLKGWSLKDASSSGTYEIEKDFFIEPKEYTVIYRKDFGFALNNSGDENVFLFSPPGEEISAVEYSGADEDISYNFDDKKWRWSKDITPGKENIFNNLPKYSFSIPEESYKNVYTYFEVEANDKDGDEVEVTWDFGDDHKSYLMKTKHKYLENGKYLGSLKITDGSEDILEKFEIEIKNLSHPKVKIVSINPNPVGKDSELETITIKNDSKKKINLLGWGVATGWKSLVNHPIRENFEIKSGKTKVLTREYSAFSLNNKKQKIELRYPDGEVAYDVKYKSEESVEEGSLYGKTKKKWKWIFSEKEIESSNQKEDIINNQVLIIEPQIKAEDLGKKSERKQESIFEKVEKVSVLNFPENNLSRPLVLGVNALWVDENGNYRFIYESSESNHYAISFANNLYININKKLNLLLNYFSK